jgi:hypothetical protein
LLSPLSPSFFFFSLLSSPPLSVLFSKPDLRFGEGRAKTAAKRMARMAFRVNLRALGACEASLLHPEAPKPVSWRGQHAKINKIHCSLKTKIFFDRYAKRI